MELNKIENKNFFDLTSIRLHRSSLLKLFNALEDLDRNKILNIFKSYEINEKVYRGASILQKYTIEERDWLDNISAQFYETPHLWWLIAMLNNITNPYEELEAGKEIYILNASYIYVVFKDMEAISEL